jgi:hypothetical protein
MLTGKLLMFLSVNSHTIAFGDFFSSLLGKDQTASNTERPCPTPKTGHLKGTGAAFRHAQVLLGKLNPSFSPW